MFDVYTRGDNAHIDKIFKLLTRVWQQLVVKKKLFQFSCGCEQFH